MKRALVLGSVVGFGVVAIAVGQAPQQNAPAGNAPRFPPIESIENVAPNLYRITGQGGNSAVFVRDDGVLLVDTKLANNGQALLDQIKKVTNKPITHIVNTHTHGDHTGSNSFFPASVEIVTQENTATNMKKMEAFQSADGKDGRRALRSMGSMLPTRTWERLSPIIPRVRFRNLAFSSRRSIWRRS